MLLPNVAPASVDIVKLREYSLSPDHPEGKHKARVFRSAFGLESVDAEWLREQLLRVAVMAPCQLGRNTEFGLRYSVDFSVFRHGKTATVRSAWIVRRGEQFPRLTSCYVL